MGNCLTFPCIAETKRNTDSYDDIHFPGKIISNTKIVLQRLHTHVQVSKVTMKN